MSSEVASGVVVRPASLKSFLLSVLEALGADREIAVEAADHLVGANLAGHDSHGLQRISLYVHQTESGQLFPAARGRALKESPSLLLFDAERGLGQWSTRKALDWCLDHAERSGIAAASIRHSNHIGRLGHYAEMAARRGLASIVTVGTIGPGGGAVPPFGGIGRVLGTNPWCFGVPVEGRPPFIADFATSQVAEGKVRVARYRGKTMAEGILLDRDGNPTTVPDDLYSGGTILPLGGQLTGHKGYGLGMAAALFGSLGSIGDEDRSSAGTSATARPDTDWTGGVFLQVVDPSWFGDAGVFLRDTAAALQAVTQTPPVAGVDRVLVPGEPEALSRHERERDGLEIPSSLWAELETIAERYQLAMPEVSG